MKNALGKEGSGPPLGGALRRLGDTLLRFAGEDRRLDQDALYESWAQTDDRCWMDTEQEQRQMPLHGLPEGARPVVADGAVVQGANDSGFAPVSGWGNDTLRAFQTEIEHWRRQRSGSTAQMPAVQPGAAQLRPRPLRTRRSP